MPHIWIEYSANLESSVDPSAIVRNLHKAAIEAKLFPVGGIRTRIRAEECYCIADGHSENAFVHVVVRVAAGRDMATRKKIGELMFASLCRLLDPLYQTVPLGLSLEVQELDADLNFKQNNLQDFVERRTNTSTIRATP
jgi:5-carboxymethyl-2-hydroxymuconate isomerase